MFVLGPEWCASICLQLWVGRLLLYSSVLYLFTSFTVYCLYLPDEWLQRLAMALPFFIYPILWVLVFITNPNSLLNITVSCWYFRFVLYCVFWFGSIAVYEFNKAIKTEARAPTDEFENVEWNTNLCLNVLFPSFPVCGSSGSCCFSCFPNLLRETVSSQSVFWGFFPSLFFL